MINGSICYRPPKSESAQTNAIGHSPSEDTVNTKRTNRRLQNLYALSDLKVGDLGKVAFIRAESPVLENIFSMGFTFEAWITVEAVTNGVLEVKVGEYNVLMGQDLAAKIFVESPQK
jgi:Fe2+ transport system protein FeoA